MPRDIDEAIRETEAQITRLQSKLAVLREAKLLLETPEEAGRRVIARRATHPSGPVPLAAVPKTSVEYAIAALREAGKPMHVDQIIDWANARGGKIQKPTLTSNLIRLLKNPNSVFTKAGPNIFGLRDYAAAVAPTNGNGRHSAPGGTEAAMTDAIVNYLSTNRGRVFGASQIAGAIGVENVHSVRSALQRLDARKRIQRLARGLYGIEVQSEAS